MSDENEKSSGGKILRNIIIGGAIASVLGMHLLPKKTKRAIKKKAQNLIDKIGEKIEELEEKEE